MSNSNKRYSKAENIVTGIVLVVLAIIIVWSASKLISAFIEYYKGQSEYSDIRGEFGMTSAAEEITNATDIEDRQEQQLAELLDKVKDWEDLDTPVTQPTEAMTEAITEQETGTENPTNENPVEVRPLEPIILPTRTIYRQVGQRQYIRPGDIRVNGLNVKYYIAARYDMDLSQLKAINSEVIGWIRIDGTNIDYPFAQTTDNDKYIRQTIYGTQNAAGSIFVDCHVEQPFYTQNTILYGHNQRNKQMFHDLVNYEKSEYCQAHPIVSIYLENETRLYQIFSCYVTQNVSITYDCNYVSNGEYQLYLNQVQEWSLYDTGVTATTEDEIITLSTCTNDWEDQRFVVHAKRVL